METGNLILTRRSGEKVIIGNNTIVEIISVDHGNVKISFSAPKNIPIYREEIYEKVQDETVNL